jgi:hypothetical protein
MRQFYTNENLNDDGYRPVLSDKLYPATEEAANLVSSFEIDKFGAPTGMHLPAIDIDLPVRVVESSTPGHHHLYIDKPVTWDQYRMLLRVLEICGIVEKGYVDVSEKRGATFVRKPGVTK